MAQGEVLGPSGPPLGYASVSNIYSVFFLNVLHVMFVTKTSCSQILCGLIFTKFSGEVSNCCLIRY